jgi:hypothetical protein
MATPRDANRIPVMVGVSTADGKTILPILIDSVSGRVMVNVLSDSDTDTLVPSPLKRDANYIPVTGGASSSDQKTILPFLISSSNGGLSVEIS